MRIVTAAVVRHAGNILLTRRGPGGKHEGLWEFPGGKLEDGESLEECLEREILEELGVKAKAGRVLCTSQFTYDHGSIKLIAIDTDIEASSFTLRDHDQFEWVPPERLLEYQLLPADIPIAEYLRDGG